MSSTPRAESRPKTRRSSGPQKAYPQRSLLRIPGAPLPRNKQIPVGANKLGFRLKLRRCHRGTSWPPTFIVVIASDIPMPGHGGEEGVRHSVLTKHRLRNRSGAICARRTPKRHVGFRQAPAPSACARRTSCLRTARDGNLSGSPPPRERMRIRADGRVLLGVAPPTGRLTDSSSKEAGFHGSQFVDLDQQLLEGTRVPDYFSRFGF